MNVVIRGKWKPIELEPYLFLQKDMDHLICIEELTDYNIVDGRNAEVFCKIFHFCIIARPDGYNYELKIL